MSYHLRLQLESYFPWSIWEFLGCACLLLDVSYVLPILLCLSHFILEQNFWDVKSRYLSKSSATCLEPEDSFLCWSESDNFFFFAR
jgi:hypothetical protein